MLKAVRNLVVANRPVQGAIRTASRSGRLPSALLRRLPALGPHPMTSPAGNDFTYVGHFDDMLARSVVWDNLSVWEATSLRVFSQLVRTSRTFLDVGAYTGVYSLIACADGSGDVIAFEPNPAIRPMLRSNIAVNQLEDRITVVPKGASDAPGRSRMTIPIEDTTSGRVDRNGTGPTVDLVTIDQVLDGRPVDLIKLDVEGHEPQALEGGRKSIATHHPALIVECLDPEAFKAVRAILEPLAYRSCLHLGSDGPRRTTQHIDVAGHANFLWISEHRPDPCLT